MQHFRFPTEPKLILPNFELKIYPCKCWQAKWRENETTVNDNNGIGDACSTVDIFNGCYRRTLLPLSLVSRFSRSILAGGNVLLGGRAQFPESGAESSNKGETDENKELFFKLCLFRGPAHKWYSEFLILKKFSHISNFEQVPRFSAHFQESRNQTRDILTFENWIY